MSCAKGEEPVVVVATPPGHNDLVGRGCHVGCAHRE